MNNETGHLSYKMNLKHISNLQTVSLMKLSLLPLTLLILILTGCSASSSMANQEQKAAQQLDPPLRRDAQPFADEVDPHVRILDVGKPDAQEKQDRVNVPLAFLQLGRTQHEKAPGDHVEDDDDHQRDRHPGADTADKDHKPIQEFLEAKKCMHAAGPPRPSG